MEREILFVSLLFFSSPVPFCSLNNQRPTFITIKIIEIDIARAIEMLCSRERERERWPFYFFCRFVEINSNFFLWSDSFRRLGGGESQSCSYCINSNWSIQSDQENGDYLVETISIWNSISKKKKLSKSFSKDVLDSRTRSFCTKLSSWWSCLIAGLIGCWTKIYRKKKLKLTVA